MLFVLLFQPTKFLCDWILGKGMTVGEVKKELLEEIKRRYTIDIPFERSVWPPGSVTISKREHRYRLLKVGASVFTLRL
jgi:hypothetical protein